MEVQNLKKHNAGNIDQPIDPAQGGIDLLNLEPYIKGLSDYIENCATPMTIAIQGDWGTGKTSMMNMIKHRIAPEKPENNANNDICTLWFNTWQYSQFNMSQNLPISLLSYMVEKICQEDDKKEKMKNLLNMVGKIAIIGFKATASVVAGINTNDIMQSQREVKSNFAEELETLKDDFKKAVANLLKTNNKKRLVVFIDDLDRLNPEIAVEVLEVLKVFLDVENCVYVLAVDYEVVSQGIKKKFGENVTSEKGKSFFDKMIQLPFKMPVPLFKLDKFLKGQLCIYGITNDKVITRFEELIRGSIGRNPRTMKRLFNSFQLISSIIKYDEGKDKSEEYENELLFSVLCLQMAFEPLYEYFMGTNEWIDSEDEDNIFKLNEENIIKKLSAYHEIINHKHATRILNFLEILSKTIFINEKLTPESAEYHLERFKDILYYSSITTTSDTSGDVDVEITLNDNITGASITRVRYKEGNFDAKGFTSAFVWILDQIGKDGKNKEKFNDILNYSENYNISKRFFNAANLDQKFKSSIKYVNSLDVKVVTHYSSNELKAILIKILDALDIPLDDVSLYGVKKK